MANLRPSPDPDPQHHHGYDCPNCVRIEIDNPTIAILLALGVGAVVCAATAAAVRDLPESWRRNATPSDRTRTLVAPRSRTKSNERWRLAFRLRRLQFP